MEEARSSYRGSVPIFIMSAEEAEKHFPGEKLETPCKMLIGKVWVLSGDPFGDTFIDAEPEIQDYFLYFRSEAETALFDWMTKQGKLLRDIQSGKELISATFPTAFVQQLQQMPNYANIRQRKRPNKGKNKEVEAA